MEESVKDHWDPVFDDVGKKTRVSKKDNTHPLLLSTKMLATPRSTTSAITTLLSSPNRHVSNTEDYRTACVTWVKTVSVQSVGSL